MLNDKKDVIKDDHDSKNQFNNIDFNIKSKNGLKAHLSKREKTSGKIHQNIEN